jgi:hypothetical protein
MKQIYPLNTLLLSPMLPSIHSTPLPKLMMSIVTTIFSECCWAFFAASLQDEIEYSYHHLPKLRLSILTTVSLGWNLVFLPLPLRTIYNSLCLKIHLNSTILNIAIRCIITSLTHGMPSIILKIFLNITTLDFFQDSPTSFKVLLSLLSVASSKVLCYESSTSSA